MNLTFIKPRGRHFSLVKKILCAGALLLGSYTDTSAQFVKIGEGVGFNAINQSPTPFNNFFGGQKAQYLYRKDELITQGLKPGWIDALGFFVTNTNGAVGHTGFRLFIGSGTGPFSGAAGNMTSGFMPMKDLELIYYDKILSYLPKSGWNDFSFNAPYYWNGEDNIVVGTCFYTGSEFNSASVEWTTPVDGSPGFVAKLARTHTIPSSPSGSAAVCDVEGTAGATSDERPNIRFFNKKDTCGVKPDAGKAIASVTEFCLKNDSLELNLSGNSLSVGLSFQWQSSPSPTGPWTNLGSPSTTKTTRKAYQTISTYYRCIVSCAYSTAKDTSSFVFVAQAAPFKCDCLSESKSNAQEKILSVSLSGLFNATPCTPGAGLYSDFTATLAPAELEPGTEYTLSTRLGSCAPANNSRGVKVFIDYNQNTEYETSEMVYANTYSAAQPNPQNAVGNFTVPLSARLGLTTMRIVYVQKNSLSDINPCGDYPFGETQDYAINILPFGKPTVTGRLKVCEYDSVVMNASSNADTPVIFTWTGPGGFTAIGPKITFVDADPSLSGTYYVTATSGGRTSTPQSVEILVSPKPPVPHVLNSTICQYDSDGTLRTDGKNVIWYNVPVGGFGDTVAPKVPTHTPNEATFYVTQTVNGCVSDRAKVVVNVLLKPAPPVVKSPVTYCQLQDPELVAKGVNLRWYLDSAGGVPSTISPIPPTGFPDEIDYYVTQTVNGCESDRIRVRVIVYEQPNGLILHTKPYVCQYDTASFIYFGNAPLSYDYKWFSADAILEQGGSQGPVVFRFNTPGEKVINLFVNNGKCATSKIVDTITVRPAPTAVIDTVYNACIDVPVMITIDTATPNANNYTWDWGGGTLTSETVDGGPYYVSWSTPGIKTLGLVVYNRTCPSLPISQSFLIRDRPIAKIISKQIITNYGKDTADVNGKICSRDTIQFTAYKDESYTYKWYPEYYFDRDTDNIVSDRMRNSAFIRVDVENEFGCKASDSTFINAEACCEMSFPNAFTPNGDNRNDIFRPIRDGRQDIVTFRIVNRWGQVVFETASTDTQGWDGTFAGKPQDMGVYQYYIKYQCLDGVYYEKKGDVTLIR